MHVKVMAPTNQTIFYLEPQTWVSHEIHGLIKENKCDYRVPSPTMGVEVMT